MRFWVNGALLAGLLSCGGSVVVEGEETSSGGTGAAGASRFCDVIHGPVESLTDEHECTKLCKPEETCTYAPYDLGWYCLSGPMQICNQSLGPLAEFDHQSGTVFCYSDQVCTFVEAVGYWTCLSGPPVFCSPVNGPLPEPDGDPGTELCWSDSQCTADGCITRCLQGYN